MPARGSRELLQASFADRIYSPTCRILQETTMANSAGPILLSALDNKAKRDLYLELIRETNPAQAYFTKGEVTNGFTPDIEPLFVVKGKASAAMSTTTSATAAPAARHSGCHTQKTSATGVDELFLGNSKGTLYLWKTGSKINWIARKDGYPSTDDALFAARECYTATAAWNKALEGRVEFVYVDYASDACFEVMFDDAPPDENALASAFFPDEYSVVLNQVKVYPLTVQKNYRSEAPYTFAHELGHVLGLRHEHSQSNVQGGRTEDGTTDGETSESILFGLRNPWSVMAYYDQCTIQPSDVKTLNLAYDTLKDGEMISGTALVGKYDWRKPEGDRTDKRKKVTVEKKIYRVAPDN